MLIGFDFKTDDKISISMATQQDAIKYIKMEDESSLPTDKLTAYEEKLKKKQMMYNYDAEEGNVDEILLDSGAEWQKDDAAILYIWGKEIESDGAKSLFCRKGITLDPYDNRSAPGMS